MEGCKFQVSARYGLLFSIRTSSVLATSVMHSRIAWPFLLNVYIDFICAVSGQEKNRNEADRDYIATVFTREKHKQESSGVN